MSKPRRRNRGTDPEIPAGQSHRPRVARPHLAAEIADTGNLEDARLLVRRLKPWAQDAALGQATGSTPRHQWSEAA